MRNSRFIIKNHRQEISLFQRRLLLVAAITTALIFILLGRIFYLQILEHRLYSTLSRQNYLALVPLEPKRGLIMDRNGVILADNRPTFSLDLIRDQIPNLKATINELSKVIKIDDNDVALFYRSLDGKKRFEAVPIRFNLTEEELAKIYLNQYRLPGVVINARLIRNYPLIDTTVSAVGYVGRINIKELSSIDSTNYNGSDFIGKIGIEKRYETLLRGKIGYTQAEIDVSGKIIRTLNTIPPTPGTDIYLTIDSKMQQVAKEALGKERGAVVAIDPSTGEVLALISNPGFDPNLFVSGIPTKIFSALQNSPDKPLYNRTINGRFPIASTIKPFIAIAALDAGTIDEKYSINDTGSFQLPNTKQVYHDWQRAGHGRVNVTKAIIVSCDTFFYNLSVMLGIRKIDAMLEKFGFGRKTNIDLDEEQSGSVASPELKRAHGGHWYIGDTIISAIGQGMMSTTPLQLANAVAIIANRGQHFTPHLFLKAVSSNSIAPINNTNTVVLKDPKIWDLIINAMHSVITIGTGSYHFGSDAKYMVAGKTGTAQLYRRANADETASADESKIPKKLRNNSLFIAFAPIDKPKIAIAVIVENNGIAGNVARKVMDYYFNENDQSNKQP